ncbi:hypothetical protein Tco_0041563, partial [Tanacetum coccineum]
MLDHVGTTGPPTNTYNKPFGLRIWSQEPILSSRPTVVEVPKELPKVSMVNTSLKKLKHHLAGFNVVVIERTTPTAITEGSWGFEHTKACFRDDIIPFVKALKDFFNTFNQYLVDELLESQEKDTIIKKLKERIKSLSGKMNEDKIKSTGSGGAKILVPNSKSGVTSAKGSLAPEMLWHQNS